MLSVKFVLFFCWFSAVCSALRIMPSRVRSGATIVSPRNPTIDRKGAKLSNAARMIERTITSLHCSSTEIVSSDTKASGTKVYSANQAAIRQAVKRPKADPGLKAKETIPKKFMGPQCEPSNAYLNLDYNYLSTNSIHTIRHQWKQEEASKHRQASGTVSKGRVGDEFLTKWWNAATKWGLLTGTLQSHNKAQNAAHTLDTVAETVVAEPEELGIDTLATASMGILDAVTAPVATTTQEEPENTAVAMVEGSAENVPPNESQQLLNDIWAGRISQVLTKHINKLKSSLESIATASKVDQAESVTSYFHNITMHNKIELDYSKKKTKLENEPLYSSKMSRKAKYNATSSGQGFGGFKRDVPDASALVSKMLEKSERQALDRKKQQWKNAQKEHHKAHGDASAGATIDLGTNNAVGSAKAIVVAEGVQVLGSPTSSHTTSAVQQNTAPESSETSGIGAIAAATTNTAPNAKEGAAPLEQLHDMCRNHIARVICIGDVHGCVEEVCDLLRSVQYAPGDQVVFLGDLVAKGPDSLSVIQLAMDIGALSVRGNHDHEVIRQRTKFLQRAATAAAKKKAERAAVNQHSEALRALTVARELAASAAELAAQIAQDTEDTRLIETLAQHAISVDTKAINAMSPHLRIGLSLTPTEVSWLSNLPYFVRSLDLGAVFVHAGLMSGVKLQKQEPWIMMTMRSQVGAGKATSRSLSAHPWAKRWPGPLTVYFGHDTARGLQQYPSAYGIDTGCVYGGNLTAVLLPEQKVVSVPARKAYLKYKKSLDYV